MARDVGSYFEKLTKKAPGGRRLESDGDRTDDSQGSGDEYEYEQPSSARSQTEPSSGRSGGSIGDILKDVLARGRTSATKTAKKTTERVRSRTGRSSSTKTKTLPPEGVVTVEYSPRMDGDPDPGEVVWAWVPFEEDPEQGKDRPVVVIGRRGSKLVGVPLTTKRSNREAQIALGTGDWDPKHRQSFARIWRMLDLEEEGTRREGAVLDRKRFDQVITAVDEYYDVRRPSASNKSTRSSSNDSGFDYDY